MDETKKNNWKIHSYNIRGELKWEKDYKSESISDIAINDKGHFVILEKANKPFISENKISLMDKNGNLIKEMGLDFHLNRVEFKNKKNIVLWNWLERNHYKMEIKIIK